MFGGSGTDCWASRVAGWLMVLGDMGGDASDDLGCLGNGDPKGLSVGRGLEGRPGLMRGDATLRLAIIELSEFVGLRRAFKEFAGGCRGESGRPDWRALI